MEFQKTGTLDVLDVSAGTGILAESLIEKFGSPGRFVLNDPAEMMLDIAKDRLRHFPNIEFSSHYAEELNRLEGSFDHIICLNSFHYFVDQPLVLDHIRKLLKPDGMLWLQDWNRKGLFRVAIRLIDLLSPEHISTRNIHEMQSMLSERDFKIMKEEEWRFRWWNFCFLKATLSD
jgi:ubiquinone/menaquinone biosynthesis C-methylase UbiE